MNSIMARRVVHYRYWIPPFCPEFLQKWQEVWAQIELAEAIPIHAAFPTISTLQLFVSLEDLFGRFAPTPAFSDILRSVIFDLLRDCEPECIEGAPLLILLIEGLLSFIFLGLDTGK